MKNNPYYNDKEQVAATENLLLAGRPLADICKDPRCQPDVKRKLQELLSLEQKKKGGQL